MTTAAAPIADHRSLRLNPSPKAAQACAVLLVLQSICMWSAFFVLAPAIDWPASLDLPASEMLPLYLEQFDAVFVGYSLYLAHALLLIPLAATLRHALGLSGPGGELIVALGVLAGFAKALGIVRWLFMTPTLAESWTAPEASDATRAAVSVVFDAFNAYVGGVGELLGVGLFVGVWTMLIAAVLFRRGATVLGATAVVAALLLFATLPSVLGVDMPALLTASGVFWQLWSVAFAVWIWRGADGSERSQ